MKLSFLILCIVSLASAPMFGQEQPVPLPPLHERQIIQVRELVQMTQSRTTLLQARLSERQRDLARVYAQYDLDETQARRIQEEIIDLQRQLLAGHHRMQTELRTIVGRDRFDFLRRRLEQAVASDPVTAPKNHGNSPNESNSPEPQ
jgi:hypothetical protein